MVSLEGWTGADPGVGPWCHAEYLDFVMQPLPRLSGPLPASEPPLGGFSTHWVSVLDSRPSPGSDEGALAGALVPVMPVRQACSCRALHHRAPAGGHLPGLQPAQGRLFFLLGAEAELVSPPPPLRNRASEAHNAAVKISGSGLAAAQQTPCSPRRQRTQGPSWACLCWPPAGGVGRGETPGLARDFCCFGPVHGGRGQTAAFGIGRTARSREMPA